MKPSPFSSTMRSILPIIASLAPNPTPVSLFHPADGICARSTTMTGSMTETKIALTTADGVADCHTFHPPGAGPWRGVIFYMDGLAIRPDLFAMARRLASHGYFVALPDLYYRSG